MKRSRLGFLIAVGAIAVGATIGLTAPAAQAERISETTIKDNEGDSSTDYYANGEYYSTRPGRPA